MTHTAVLVIQDSETALDRAREGKRDYAHDEDDVTKYDRLIHYLESVGK